MVRALSAALSTHCMLTHPETDTDTLDRVHAVQLAGAYSPSVREAENYNG